MLITRKSTLSGVERTRDLPVDPEHYALWKLGTPIQAAMPYLSAGDREFIMTGITQEEWNAAFAYEGDD